MYMSLFYSFLQFLVFVKFSVAKFYLKICFSWKNLQVAEKDKKCTFTFPFEICIYFLVTCNKLKSFSEEVKLILL